jgi:hypothetical protein
MGLALWRMSAVVITGCHHLREQKLHPKNWEHFENSFFCTLGEKFEETTDDSRKIQTDCNFTVSALGQLQEWGRKDCTLTKKIERWEINVRLHHE